MPPPYEKKNLLLHVLLKSQEGDARLAYDLLVAHQANLGPIGLRPDLAVSEEVLLIHINDAIADEESNNSMSPWL